MDPHVHVLAAHDRIYVRRRDAPEAAWYCFSIGKDGHLTHTRTALSPSDASVHRSVHAHAVYGFFHLLHGYYLAVVTKHRRVCVGPNESTIYAMEDMEWIPVDASSVHAKARTASDEEDARADQLYLSLLHRIASTRSFYYAVGDYDITHCLQRNDAAAVGVPVVPPPVTSEDALEHAHEHLHPHTHAESLPAPPVGTAVPVVPRTSTSWTHADDRFFWNAAGIAELQAAGADELITPFINGFVCAAPITEFGGVRLLMISRRARTRQGTRFNMRGVDRDGNVANYAETEQMIFHPDGAVSSHVQIRGSIPLLWEQPVTMKYTPRAVLAADTTASQTAFARHMLAQLSRYGHITAVNLIDRKKDQLKLGEAYEKAVTRFADEGVRYVWFDFHHECRNMKWHNLDKLLKLVEDQTTRYGFYQRDGTRTVTRVQAGVFRTNCMDNLDRTNVVQSLFARQAALAALPGALELTRKSGCSVLTSPFEEFEFRFNNMWADNADALSNLYSGTGALKTDFTRTGKRTLMGYVNDGMNSVMRYVYNNLSDGGTQDAWDLFLGRFVPGKHHHHGFHPHGHGLHRSSSSKSTTAPLKAHLRQTTPTSFLVRVVAFFAGVSILASLTVAPSHYTPAGKALTGMAAAAVVVGALSYMVVSKGASFGKVFVSRPTFIRERSVSSLAVEQLKSIGVPPGSSEPGATVGAENGGSLSGRVKLA